MGFREPAFKVFKESKDHFCMPRYYGVEHLGKPEKDKRPDPVNANINFIGTLKRETHQIEALEKCIDTFQTIGGGVLSLAPGFGKTICALAIAGHFKVRTMIVVHKEFLAEQWESRIRSFCPGATIGRVQQDKCETNNDFIIAMIQTLSLREHEMKEFDTIGLLIVDEAHHIGSRAFSQSMFKLCPKYTLGLTATPDRKDGLTRLLYWFLGPNFLTVERENQKTVEVFPLHFKHPEFSKSPPCNKFGGLSIVDMINVLVCIPERNQLILETINKSLEKGRKILILSDRRGHCFELEAALGPEICGVYLGGMKQGELNLSAEKRVIIGTFALAQEGLDIPSLDTIILTTPHSDVKQAVGRILRETKGKNNHPIIYDIVDHWSILFNMFSKRCQMYRDAGFQLPVVTVPQVKGCMIKF
jgi:superfamily II DNA or RNA helicase